MNRFWGSAVATWGLAGVIAVLGFAIYRLTDVTLDAFNHPFAWHHWLLLLANIVFMAYTEGYRGFQLSYSPKVVDRARNLAEATPRLSSILLAPLYCMHYFDTTRRQLISTYVLTVMIVLLIIVFHQLSQPWRGILDAGVIVGLSWGVISILLLAMKNRRSS